MQPPEAGHAEPTPQIEPPRHVEAGQAGYDDGGSCLPNEAVLDRLERFQAVLPQVTAADRRQCHGRSHRDPTDPDNDSQDVQGASNDNVRHGRPRGRDGGASVRSNLRSRCSIGPSSHAFERQRTYPRNKSENLLWSKLLAVSGLTG